jgi:hypothetical protein
MNDCVDTFQTWNIGIRKSRFRVPFDLVRFFRLTSAGEQKIMPFGFQGCLQSPSDQAACTRDKYFHDIP